MDKIKCAVCGGQKIRKESDLYVCQTCGIEYTLGQVQELYYQKNLKQEDLLAKAKECYRRKEYRKSCRLCQQLLASGAKEPEAQLYLALSQARLHFHSKSAREQLVILNADLARERRTRVVKRGKEEIAAVAAVGEVRMRRVVHAAAELAVERKQTGRIALNEQHGHENSSLLHWKICKPKRENEKARRTRVCQTNNFCG